MEASLHHLSDCQRVRPRSARPRCGTVRHRSDRPTAAYRPGPSTAIVTLSHDTKIDDPALVAALASPARYVGALGSRRSHAARRERLAAEGVTAEQLDRIDAPVGIDIGAIGPSEIALSISAAVVGAFHAQG